MRAWRVSVTLVTKFSVFSGQRTNRTEALAFGILRGVFPDPRNDKNDNRGDTEEVQQPFVFEVIFKLFAQRVLTFVQLLFIEPAAVSFEGAAPRLGKLLHGVTIHAVIDYPERNKKNRRPDELPESLLHDVRAENGGHTL